MAALGVDYLFVVDFTPDLPAFPRRNSDGKSWAGSTSERSSSVWITDTDSGEREKPGKFARKYPVLVLDKIIHNEKKIGSSIIRSLLASGKTEEAASLLGRHYSITGRGHTRGTGWAEKSDFPPPTSKWPGTIIFEEGASMP